MTRTLRHAGGAAVSLVLAALSGQALAACPERVPVVRGDTAASIARACGVNVEALKRLNPGMRDGRLQPGVSVNVPRPALPSTQNPVGQPRVGTAPSIVTSPRVGGPSTVILPPPEPAVPPQHILRGFGNQPDSFPSIPGPSVPGGLKLRP